MCLFAHSLINLRNKTIKSSPSHQDIYLTWQQLLSSRTTVRVSHLVICPGKVKLTTALFLITDDEEEEEEKEEEDIEVEVLGLGTVVI